MTRREGTADCILEKDTPPRLVDNIWDGLLEDDVQEEVYSRPARIGTYKPSHTDDLFFIEATVSITVETFPEKVKEFHKVRFTPHDWDTFARIVRKNQTVTFKGAEIYFDETAKKTVIDTETHIDFGGPDGSISGSDFNVHREYVKGYIHSCSSIELTSKVVFPDDNVQSDAPFLPTSDELRKSWVAERKAAKKRPRYTFEDFNDETFPEPIPSLSDYYDDLEELELNTRGDGYD